MDHAVSLVQAYLQLNGYFTSAEYALVESLGQKRYRAVTDIDILAYRFPGGSSQPVRPGDLHGVEIGQLDPGLEIPHDRIDMIIGEVKEGRVGVNPEAVKPEVVRAAIDRFGCAGGVADEVVAEFLQRGFARVENYGQVRLIAFGAMPPDTPVPPCRIISLGHVLDYLQTYVRNHWRMMRQCQFKDPALGFLMTLEKARRGAAGRRGEGGVEVVTGEDRASGRPESAPPVRSKRRRRPARR